MKRSTQQPSLKVRGLQRGAALEYKVSKGQWGKGEEMGGARRQVENFKWVGVKKEGVMEVIKQRARLQFLSHFLPLLITLWNGLGTRGRLRNPLMQ